MQGVGLRWAYYRSFRFCFGCFSVFCFRALFFLGGGGWWGDSRDYW